MALLIESVVALGAASAVCSAAAAVGLALVKALRAVTIELVALAVAVARPPSWPVALPAAALRPSCGANALCKASAAFNVLALLQAVCSVARLAAACVVLVLLPVGIAAIAVCRLLMSRSSCVVVPLVLIALAAA